MRIDSVFIEQLGTFHKTLLRFAQPAADHFGRLGVSIMVGRNGTGKTSVLRFLARAFCNVEPQTAFEIRYRLGSREYQFSGNSPEETEVQYPRKVIVSSYSSFDKFDLSCPKGLRPTRYVYVGTSGMNRPTQSYLPILRALFNMHERNKDGKDDRKGDSVKKLLEHIGYGTQVQVAVYPSPLYRGKPIKDELQGIFLQGGGRMLAERPENEKLLSRLDQFHRDQYPDAPQGEYARFAAETLGLYPWDGLEGWLRDVSRLQSRGVVYVADLLFPKGTDSRVWVPMAEFSSGELSLFYRFFRIIDNMTDDALVLVDEPEVHLHPAWIRRYIAMLSSLLGQYDSHVIMATHSPLIAADLPRECIVMLKPGRRQVWVAQERIADQTMGSSQDDILQDVFRVKQPYGDHTLGVISRIETVLDEENRGQARAAEAEALLNDLGDSDEKFRLFLMLMKRYKELQ